jgi:hypothetical protein
MVAVRSGIFTLLLRNDFAAVEDISCSWLKSFWLETGSVSFSDLGEVVALPE